MKKNKCMKSIKSLSILFFITFVISLSGQSEVKAPVEMMIGRIKASDFLKTPYKSWYKEEYNAYNVDVKELLKCEKIDKSIKIKVFFGSWCGDSRREVPRFIKILDYLKFKNKRVQYTGLDRSKTAPGMNLIEYNIQYVPTFIFYRNGKEIGRIIEAPAESLEKDLIRILSNK
jgi:hypothetical protein